MKATVIAIGPLVFWVFLIFICLGLAHGYVGAQHCSCGTVETGSDAVAALFALVPSSAMITTVWGYTETLMLQ